MITNRDIYQLYHNKAWIEGLEGQEIAYFDVDSMENNWVLYKPRYTTAIANSNRLQTQKNRAGDILLRKKNKPIGFKLNSSTETDIDGVGRKYQAQVQNQTLREILDGNIYDLKLYGNIGTVFGKDDAGDFYSICFEVGNPVLNDSDEEFILLTVLNSDSITSLYSFVDNLVYNNNFYTITYDGANALTTQKFNISFGINEGSVTSTFTTDSYNATSQNDLNGLSYPPVSSRLISINGVPTNKLGRIWTTSYSDNNIFLAYECSVPASRSAVTGVTEGVGLIIASLDGFLESSNTPLSYYMYDTVEDLPKVADAEYCQCFIPDYTDEQQSFGHSITIDGTRLIVGSPEEDAIYVFDLSLTATPDLFGSPPTTLPTNGLRIDKDYSLEQTPVFPVRVNGLMDFEIFGDVDILWRYPDGSLASGAHATGYISGVDTYYLFCSNFLNGDVTIKANNTAGFVGSLNDIPNLSFGIDVSNTMASGHFGDDFQATNINIENTNVSQDDLELSVIILDQAGNVSGTLIAYDGLPQIIGNDAIAAVNSLKAKAWNMDVNMPFDDIDPAFDIEALPIDGKIDVFTVHEEYPWILDGTPTSGAIEYMIPDTIIVTGSYMAIVDGFYAANGFYNSRPKWTKSTSPFNDIECNAHWEIRHEIPASGTYYNNPFSDYLPEKSTWSPGDVGLPPAPTLKYVYL